MVLQSPNTTGGSGVGGGTVSESPLLRSPVASGGGGSRVESSIQDLRRGITTQALSTVSTSNSAPDVEQLKNLFINFSVSQDMLPGQNSNG